MKYRITILILGVWAIVAGCRQNAEEMGPGEGVSAQNPSAPIAELVVQPLEQTDPVSESSPLFEKLDAESLGIDFAHVWKPRDRYEAQLLKTGFTGGGVCLGDYDGDGLCDIYLTRPHEGGRLFRNLGGFRFQDVTQAAGIARRDDWCTGATFIDIDNDGDLDLVVNAYDTSNRLFINRGDSTFREAASAGLSFRGASIKTVFADYDNDGDLDAFVVTNRLEPRGPVKIKYVGSPGKYRVAPEHRELAMAIDLPSGEQKFAKAGQFDRLYKNHLVESGTLQFSDVTSEAGLDGNYHGLDATWWDYDHDGDPDLYVANDFTDPDQWLRNNGDGTFTDVIGEIVPNTPWFAMGSAVGDLNGDGLLDLLATDMSGTTHYREKMAMGSMDSVAWFLDTAEPRQYMRNALYVNTGTERFLELAHQSGLSSSDWTWSVKIADLDNDGREDVYVTNGFTRDYLNSDFNEGLKRQGKDQDSMAWYSAPELKERNLVFRNSGDLKFVDQSDAWGVGELSICFGAAFGDFDNDGDLDLITNNFDGPPSVFRNRSEATGMSRLTMSLRGTQSNRQGIGALVTISAGGVTQTRYVNHINGYLSSNEPRVHYGLGTADRIDALQITWPSGVVQRFTDLPVNQHLVITEAESEIANEGADSIVASRADSSIFEIQELPALKHNEQPFDDFEKQPLIPNRMSQNGPGVAAADVNGDGKSDLFMGAAAGTAGQMLLSGQDGNWSSFEIPDLQLHADSEDMGCLLIDVDGDGDRDLYVVSGGVEDRGDKSRLYDRLYLNRTVETGELRFEYSADALPQLEQSGATVTACDFDRDGDLDLFVGGRSVPHAYPTGPRSVLLVNEDGAFSDATDELASGLRQIGMVTSAVWSDVNGDRWPDLIVTNDYGPIRVFENLSGRLRDVTDRAGTAEMKGWWNSITPVDVDCDGDMDYVVGNLGHNTKYHPSKKKPQSIFYGDFDNSGTKRIVEAKPGTDGLLPVRGRSCSSNAMPHLRVKFETFHEFASSSLTDIYTDECLEESLRLDVTMNSSGVLLNDGEGRLSFLSLPYMAQTAPVFGVQVCDVNGDSFPDLLLAQNFYGPQRETGRMNGGLGCLLLGKGNGEFDAIRSDESGIVVPHDAKALVRLSNPNQTTRWLASVNNGNALMVVPTAQQDDELKKNLFTIELRDLPHAGAGGRVLVRFQSGQERAIDLTCGDGYLSQSDLTRVSIGVAQNDRPVACFVFLANGKEISASISESETNVVVELGRSE